MHLSFSPMRRDDRLTLSRDGDVLTINGEAFDFSGLPEGATLPRDAVACGWLASDVARTGGEIHLTLVLPHGPTPAPEVRFPQPVTAADGPVTLPGESA